MKYVKLFETHEEYEEYAESGMILPNVSHCVQEDDIHYNPWTWAEEYLTFVAREDGTFQLSTNAVSYSLDNGETWIELAANTASPTVTAGNKIMWKGEITPTSSGIGKFSSTANFDVQGNAMSLLFGDNYKGQTDLTGKDYTFYSLFYNNTKVVNAENLSLPATTLASSCYESMFNGCTSLTTAPALPATTLKDYCYSNMFNGCTSLATTPVLPATTLAVGCYQNMFQGCTSLVNAPELPATTLTNYCYCYMFNGCSRLTTAPVLPATTLTNYCYSGMFSDCTSLTTAPELPATTLASGCYNNMFYGCSNLNYIKAMFTTRPGDVYTDSWVYNVASSGTFVKNSAASWTKTGVNGVPTGWTVQTVSA
jgi:hypothetical protein